MDKVTIASSSGWLWLSLVTHFGSALVALVAGFVALVVAKGGAAHKRSGTVFAWAMVFSLIVASGIGIYEGHPSIVGGAVLTVYLTVTAVTTVRPMSEGQRRLDITLMLMAFGFAAFTYRAGFLAWQSPRHILRGVPAQMYFFMATVTLAAVIGDLRMLRAGGITGTRRIARHLWRMCFGFFMATGSFFIGQMKFIPQPIRIVPLMIFLGVAPLLVLLYWMWRVRLRKRLAGMIIGDRREPVVRFDEQPA